MSTAYKIKVTMTVPTERGPYEFTFEFEPEGDDDPLVALLSKRLHDIRMAEIRNELNNGNLF